ncbi:MAG: hypothetical protein ABII82_13800 [Verrucomicrobiota bacterium]
MQGSTAFKQQADQEQATPWRDYFLEFVQLFPQQFVQELKALAPDYRTAHLPWKFIGDEIAYSIEVHSHAQISQLLDAFIRTVRGYAPTQSAGRMASNLKLKGCAWVAGFPVGNACIEVYGDSGKREDYLGPCVDTGFRIARLADTRRFAISAELAWLLTHPKHPRSDCRTFCYDGRKKMTGVMERDGYPAIWIDTENYNRTPLADAEDQLTGGYKNVGLGELHVFCRLYIENHGEPRFLPFFPAQLSDNREDWAVDYRATHRALLLEYTQEKAKQGVKDTNAKLGSASDAEPDNYLPPLNGESAS